MILEETKDTSDPDRFLRHWKVAQLCQAPREDPLGDSLALAPCVLFSTSLSLCCRVAPDFQTHHPNVTIFGFWYILTSICAFLLLTHLLFLEWWRRVCVCRWCVCFEKDLVGLGFERAMPLKDVLKCFDADKRVKRVINSDPPATPSGGRTLNAD